MDYIHVHITDVTLRFEMLQIILLYSHDFQSFRNVLELSIHMYIGLHNITKGVYTCSTCMYYIIICYFIIKCLASYIT